MTVAEARHTSPWSLRRLATTAAVLMATSYVAVFIADGNTFGLPVLRDALANTVAAAAAAVPVWMLCRSVPWRMAGRWWFLLVHGGGTALFAALWYLLIAGSLGTAAWLSGSPFRMQFLQGPALHWEMMTALVLYFAVAASCYTLQAIREVEKSADLLRLAEVSALRAQLDPHLLFNTLHSLLELVRSGDARADDAVDRFARVVRYVADGRHDRSGMASLGAEWQMTQDFVALESLRLGERLRCNFEIGDDLAAVPMPALTLQPLVENAIRHGIAPRPGVGHIRVSASRVGQHVLLIIDDDGLGAEARTHGSGTGLSLVQRRLTASFGGSSQFTAGPRIDAQGWRVRATIPVTTP